MFKKIVKNVGSLLNKTSSFRAVKEIAPNKIGVYLMSLNGKVMYVGRAIENRPNQSTKGLRKRLQEHWRGAANCKRELFQYRDELTVKMRVCTTVEEARVLEARLIRKYNTVEEGWNLRYED